jgi:L-ascorbate metabolism protein UlaG (beta-lactamase superfamily)
MKYNNLEILRLNHAAFKIKNQKIIYIDPFQIQPDEEADLVFITHEHFDHFSPEDLEKIVTEETFIVACHLCDLRKYKKVRLVKPNESFEVEGIKVETIPAYNINKFREPGKVFHPKEDGKVGYVLEIEGVKIYHAGDTDNIPEMANLKNIDVALLPVSGTYVMTPEEAVEAVKIIKPQLAIPMHYGAIVGSLEDAQKFKELSPISTEII